MRAELRCPATEQKRRSTGDTRHASVEARNVRRQPVEVVGLDRERVVAVTLGVAVDDDDRNGGMTSSIERVFPSAMTSKIAGQPVAQCG